MKNSPNAMEVCRGLREYGISGALVRRVPDSPKVEICLSLGDAARVVELLGAGPRRPGLSWAAGPVADF